MSNLKREGNLVEEGSRTPNDGKKSKLEDCHQTKRPSGYLNSFLDLSSENAHQRKSKMVAKKNTARRGKNCGLYLIKIIA